MMRKYAIGYPQPDGTIDIDPRDWMARNIPELLITIRECGVSGDIEILECVDTWAGDEEGQPWTYNDELRERNELN